MNKLHPVMAQALKPWTPPVSTATTAKTFTLTIDCSNDAFQADPMAEVVRILKAEAAKMERYVEGDPFACWRNTLLDVNGNSVGKAVLS